MYQQTSSGLIPGRAAPRVFVAVLALLLAASTAATVAWCASMPDMGDMSMPGGWTMSMLWMPMDGQSWISAEASFVGMWTVMMIAMMLPSLIPVLWRYRQSIGRRGGGHADAHTALSALGYFVVWTVFGAATFPVVAALAAMTMRVQSMARMVPLAIGAVVLLAGLMQFSGWKVRKLACCRAMHRDESSLPMDAGTAWRDGLHHGWHCVGCCAGLTVAWLAVGVMDLRAMAIVTVAITAERLAPASVPVARAIGIVVVVLGLLLVARAGGLA